MVSLLATGVMLIIMLAHMWEEGTKVKQLKRAQEGRNHPIEDQIFLGNTQPILQYIEGNSGHEHLLPRDVFFSEVEIPREEISISIVKVRILICACILVVRKMLGHQLLVGVEDEQKGSDLPNGMIQFGVLWCDTTMHGIMRRNK